MKFKDLVGKTIVKATQKRLRGHDDIGFLELKFSDDTKVVIVADYGDFSSASDGEYPTNIFVTGHYKRRLEKLK